MFIVPMMNAIDFFSLPRKVFYCKVRMSLTDRFLPP